MFKVDKSLMKDSQGKYLTQALFLEINYDTKYAVYSLKEEDYEFKGKVYPSLKRLYLEHEDPVEYDFARTYLADWNHWKRILANNVLSKHVEEWQEELELKLRSQSVRDIMSKCSEDSQGSFQAAKWLADKGWDKRGPGRPSKAELDKHKKLSDRIDDELSADIKRMSDYVKKV